MVIAWRLRLPRELAEVVVGEQRTSAASDRTRCRETGCVPDLAVTLKVPPPVRPISASYLSTCTLTPSIASMVGLADARLRRSLIGTPSTR